MNDINNDFKRANATCRNWRKDALSFICVLPFCILLFTLSCSHVSPIELDTEHSLDSFITSDDTDTQDTTTDTADSETAVVDTDVITYVTSDCDFLSKDECIDSSATCGLMYVLPAGRTDGSNELWAGCGGDLYFGCTSNKNCFPDIKVALDPNGKCWWMPSGCLPNEPGWKPAISDDYCKSPVLVHSCIE